MKYFCALINHQKRILKKLLIFIAVWEKIIFRRVLINTFWISVNSIGTAK